MVQSQLDQGGAVNLQDRRGRTPLCLAAKNGHVNVVELLIAAGADPNEFSGRAESPIYMASTGPHDRSEERIRVIEVLLEAGANIAIDRRHWADEPALGAAARRDLPVLEYLLSKGFSTYEPNSTYTALHSLADRHYFEKPDDLPQLIGALVESGVSVDAQTVDGYTPLYYAIHVGDFMLAAILLEHGANADLAANDGDTPLIRAIIRNSPETVELLLQHGADANTPGNLSRSPLDMARGFDNSRIVEILQRYGASG